MGYFAALYHRITVAVGEACDDGTFEDPERMRRLDVTFASRYVHMVGEVRRGQLPTRPWQVANEACRSWWPVVIQDLFLGVNAHVNLDLGIAASEVAPGEKIHDLRDDFYRLNVVLEAQVDAVRKEIVEFWPLMAITDWVGRDEDGLVDLVVVRMRDHAWDVAVKLAEAAPEHRNEVMRWASDEAMVIARMIRRPWFPVRLALALARIAEVGSTRRKIEILEGS